MLIDTQGLRALWNSFEYLIEMLKLKPLLTQQFNRKFKTIQLVEKVQIKSIQNKLFQNISSTQNDLKVQISFQLFLKFKLIQID